jgi:putative tricarboxylic transport membrane protein
MSSASAQTYPSKTIEFVVHTSAGGGSDLFARLVADIINREKMIPQPVVVVNKSGGAGAVAVNYVAERKDSHIIFTAPSATFVGVFLKAKVQATRPDCVPLAMLGQDVQVFAVQASSPYRSIKDLVAAAKQKPKKVTVGFGTIGATGHLIAFVFAQKAGIEFNYLSHKSGGDAVISLLGGRVDLCTENPSEMIQHVRAKKLRLIAIGSAERHPALPDVPTLKESGYFADISTARGFTAFKGIPDEAVNYWVSVLKKVYGNETYQKYLKENMMGSIFLSGGEYAKFLDAKHQVLYPAFKDLGLLRK